MTTGGRPGLAPAISRALLAAAGMAACLAVVAQAQLAHGPELQVNTYTTGGQGHPQVASGPRGTFVVVWTSDGSLGTDTDSTSIQGRRYDANGNPQGPQFQVNSYTTS